EMIRNPEGYLYAVASNLVKERAVLERRQAADRDIADPELAVLLAETPSFDEVVDAEIRIARLREVLMQLTPKCRAAVVMHYRYDMSYQEIADQLGISTNMVKKYLTQALALCRNRMER